MSVNPKMSPVSGFLNADIKKSWLSGGLALG
jgi:hypothetical protein